MIACDVSPVAMFLIVWPFCILAVFCPVDALQCHNIGFLFGFVFWILCVTFQCPLVHCPLLCSLIFDMNKCLEKNKLTNGHTWVGGRDAPTSKVARLLRRRESSMQTCNKISVYVVLS